MKQTYQEDRTNGPNSLKPQVQTGNKASGDKGTEISLDSAFALVRREVGPSLSMSSVILVSLMGEGWGWRERKGEGRGQCKEERKKGEQGGGRGKGKEGGKGKEEEGGEERVKREGRGRERKG